MSQWLSLSIIAGHVSTKWSWKEALELEDPLLVDARIDSSLLKVLYRAYTMNSLPTEARKELIIQPSSSFRVVYYLLS